MISASFWRGKPFECLSAWSRGKCLAAVSPEILSEYFVVSERKALEYPKIMRVAWAEALAEAAELFFPQERARCVVPDPNDEMFLECALAAEADYIVSGDKRHLLPLRQFRGIPIVSPSDFLRRL